MFFCTRQMVHYLVENNDRGAVTFLHMRFHCTLQHGQVSIWSCRYCSLRMTMNSQTSQPRPLSFRNAGNVHVKRTGLCKHAALNIFSDKCHVPLSLGCCRSFAQVKSCDDSWQRDLQNVRQIHIWISTPKLRKDHSGLPMSLGWCTRTAASIFHTPISSVPPAADEVLRDHKLLESTA